MKWKWKMFVASRIKKNSFFLIKISFQKWNIPHQTTIRQLFHVCVNVTSIHLMWYWCWCSTWEIAKEMDAPAYQPQSSPYIIYIKSLHVMLVSVSCVVNESETDFHSTIIGCWILTMSETLCDHTHIHTQWAGWLASLWRGHIISM